MGGKPVIEGRMPLAGLLPSPACGRGAGGEGARKNDIACATARPSPQPSPTSGRGSVFAVCEPHGYGSLLNYSTSSFR